MWWVQRPDEHTDFKLVLRTPELRGYHVRAMRFLLDEDGSQFVGGKILVNDDTLVILYLRAGFQVELDLLRGVADCFDASPFMPYNHTVPHPRLIWLGNSNERDSWCEPIF